MKHAVIYVFGLGDHRSRAQQIAVGLWKLQGIESSTFRMHWREPGSFEAKTRALLHRIDHLHAQGYTVSLIGTSAGASVVIALFAARQDVLHRVICICGKLQNPATVTAGRLTHNPAFGESLQMIQPSLAALSSEKLARILSIRPLMDHIVPPADTLIEGARNSTIPSVGHSFSIALAITVFSPKLFGFIRRP